ncbi:hypothetical protein AB0I66_34810 [Streptomyces sp. NPDC050439]|uniref:hypothetical protein n=1 Tax=unclassified Streptomyces TaxID=2593676 RepID=UPI0034496547
MEPEAQNVSRSDLVGRWHASKPCDSSLSLKEDGAAQWKRWVTGFNARDSRITSRQSGKGTWTLETYERKQVFELKRGDTLEPLTMLRDDEELILLQTPGEDPDNSIGCRLKLVDDPKPN